VLDPLHELAHDLDHAFDEFGRSASRPHTRRAPQTRRLPGRPIRPAGAPGIAAEKAAGGKVWEVLVRHERRRAVNTLRPTLSPEEVGFTA
jgi:hypothetical protein